MTAKELSHEYEPEIGSLGRGHEMSAESVDLSGWTPYVFPERADATSPQRIPIYGKDGIPNGKIWTGYTREEDGAHLVVAFERQATKEEAAGFLDLPSYEFAMPVREVLAARGISPEDWLNSLKAKD